MTLFFEQISAQAIVPSAIDFIKVIKQVFG
jgi:hypothetical protein